MFNECGDECWRMIGVEKRSRQVLRTVPYSECSYFTAVFPVRNGKGVQLHDCAVEVTFDPSFHTRRHVLREFSDKLSSKEKRFKVVGRDGHETPSVFR
jgi:hypothetical protein